MPASSFSILIVDDEPNIRSGLEKGLAKEAEVVVTACDADEALAKFRETAFTLVITDIRLPSAMNGLELVERMLQSRPQTTVIVITAHGSVETAVEAMRLGAFDFITKPLDLDLIRQQVRKAREHYRLRLENRVLRDQLANAGEVSGIIGNCAAMQDVLQQIRQVAGTDATVMIQGESGTGKELVARALHDLSDRNAKPFVAVNLGALPESLLESELFGHEKGSFTGASRQKPGCFERAKGGSLFLDEITEIPAKCQVDLLRVLETGQYSRIGGEEVLNSDVRLISATNKIAQAEIELGSFREDLFYRLNIVPIEIPPLRQRRDDIPLLVEHFLTHFCQRHGRPTKVIAADAMERLVVARWPGNVRQLRNVIERLVVTVGDDCIHAEDIPKELGPHPDVAAAVRTLAESVEETEKASIMSALIACDYHREKSAQLLGVSVRTLHYKMSRYGLH
ncbi:MAG: sigma-54-dependent Fis family transcriptional regulator [Planctomycetaceae bacterium]|nr:sigma-54-dependent Fis family transcriptional regulator [Planctomycetales bacterium]MCB9875883.1 sigma-54-dependent Fis family transcriptional regulator [Planctomycetaceae bacterium]MCB9941747.1 sigma-54-dependent Fis family transcriptional regulator [Planctomycetaceae bacterium]